MKSRLSQMEEMLLNALEKAGKQVIDDNKLLWIHLNNMKNGGRTFEEIIEDLKKEELIESPEHNNNKNTNL